YEWASRCHQYFSSEAAVPVIALVFPVAALVSSQHVGHSDGVEIFRLLVAEFGGHLQPERGAVSAVERLAIHFVTEQRLGMEHRFHVNRFVVSIHAFGLEKAGAGIGADRSQKIGGPRAT